MSLNQLLSGTRDDKPWCDISVNSITANTGDFKTITAGTISFTNLTAENIIANHSLLVQNDGQPGNLAEFKCDVQANNTLGVTGIATVGSLDVLNDATIDHQLIVEAKGNETSEFKYRVNISGGLGGLFLPTIGGSPSLLDYYEKGFDTFNVTGSFSNGLGVTTDYSFERIGNIVTLNLVLPATVTDVANQFIYFSPLPANLTPLLAIEYPAAVKGNGAYALGSVLIDHLNNRLQISPTIDTTPAGNKWVIAQTAELLPFSITYAI